MKPRCLNSLDVHAAVSSSVYRKASCYSPLCPEMRANEIQCSL